MEAHPCVVDRVTGALLRSDTQYLMLLLYSAEESFYEAIDDALTRLSLSNRIPSTVANVLRALADKVRNTHRGCVQVRARFLAYQKKLEYRLAHINKSSSTQLVPIAV